MGSELQFSAGLATSVTRDPVGMIPIPRPRHAIAPVRVALVNNMPDPALIATEQQFTRLVQGALDGPASVSLFHIPSLPRGEEASRHLARRYRPVSDLFGSSFDAVIVTGNEPRAARFEDEPYWDDMVQLVDWAKECTTTSLWSCLAAHAAALRLDGIERRRLPKKTSGVLSCRVRAPGIGRLPFSLSVCHSRLNELPSNALLSCGYEIVSAAYGDRVDIFARTAGSRFVFLQGHPEYDADSLMREYRRDVGRYLRGEQEFYPDLPENYFDAGTVVRLEAFRREAEPVRDAGLIEAFPATAIRTNLADRLARSAAAVYRYWLARFQAVTGVA